MLYFFQTLFVHFQHCFYFLDPNDSRWQVPITIATSKTGKKEQTTLLSDPDMVIFLQGCPKDAWVKLNPGQVCFYRTNYSKEMLKSVIPAIPSMCAVDRLGIENDMFSLASAGYSSTTNFLELLQGYEQEDNYTVWSDIDSNLSNLAVIMQNTDAVDQFKEFVQKLYKPVSERLGWEARDDEGRYFHIVNMKQTNLLYKIFWFNSTVIILSLFFDFLLLLLFFFTCT